MDPVTVAGLFVYPVKSCRGHAVDRASLDGRGLAGDRRLLVTDTAGRFLTQRTTPALARIHPTLAAASVTLSAPGHEPRTFARAAAGDATRDVVIWRDAVRAVDLGDEAAQWVSAVLGQPARLVEAGQDYHRPVTSPFARNGDEVSFADAHPLLVLSEASLEELNQRLDGPVPMDRFRPNLVLRGAGAFAEDGWSRIRIGDVVLRASGPCARCVMTTIDPETLARGPEPLRTLAQFRRSSSGEVHFGQNYINESKAGTIRRGDEVAILA